MEVFVNVDEAQEFIDFVQSRGRRGYNVSVKGETGKNKNGVSYAVIEFDTRIKKGRPSSIPREEIIKLRKQGKSISVIAKELNIPRSSVGLVAKDVVIEENSKGTLTATLPDSVDELQKLIDVMNWQIKNDLTERDKKRHQAVIDDAIRKRDILNLVQ